MELLVLVLPEAVIADEQADIRIGLLENPADLAVDCLVDLCDELLVPVLVEDGVGDLELDKPEGGIEAIGEIAEGVASHLYRIDVLLEGVHVAAWRRIDLVLADRLADVLEDPRGVAGRALGAVKSGTTASLISSGG